MTRYRCPDLAFRTLLTVLSTLYYMDIQFCDLIDFHKEHECYRNLVI